jgi:hypothetical protein
VIQTLLAVKASSEEHFLSSRMVQDSWHSHTVRLWKLDGESEKSDLRRETEVMPITKRLWLWLLLAVPAVLAGSGWAYYRWHYPYGWSHSCDKCLMFALHQYAESHGGAYPSGEATPEASLSLLYPEYANEAVLQGKTVPLDLVKVILERGEKLGPDTCGWHYVEGLTLSDDHRLALCWDKVGLGHNGERTGGGRMVLFVGCGYEYVPGAKWEAFLEEQKNLLEERNQARAETR